MKHTKEFFGVLISVLVCVFLTFLGAYAASTIANDITVGADLTVTGNDITFGNGATVENSTGAGLLTLTEDQIDIVGFATVSADFQVDGTLSIIGVASLADALNFSDGATIDNSDANTLQFTESYFDFVGFATISQDLQVETNLDVMGRASVAGQTYLYDALNFSDGATIDNGSATLLVLTENQIDIVGNATVSGDFQVEGAASIANDLSIEGGDLSVSGMASIQGDVSIEAGDFSVSGDATITGNNVTFGGGTTFANTDATLFVITEDQIDIVGHATVSGDFQVEGAASIANDLSVESGDFSVTGDSTFTGAVTVTGAFSPVNFTPTGDAIIGNSSDDVLVITGNDLGFNNGASITNTDATTITIKETYVSISNHLWVVDELHIGGAASFSETLNVTGLSTFVFATVSSDLQVETNLDVMGVASVTGQTYLYDALNFSDGATIDNDATGKMLVLTEDQIDIVGHATVSGDFQVESAASIGADLSVEGGDFSVSGMASIQGDVSIEAGDLSVSGMASISGAGLSVEAGDFSVSGTASLSDSGGLEIGGGLRFLGGTASPAGSTLNCSQGDWYFRSGAAVSTSIHFCSETNVWDEIF